jgi:hypothetical protein
MVSSFVPVAIDGCWIQRFVASLSIQHPFKEHVIIERNIVMAHNKDNRKFLLDTDQLFGETTRNEILAEYRRRQKQARQKDIDEVVKHMLALVDHAPVEDEDSDVSLSERDEIERLLRLAGVLPNRPDA